MNNTDWEKLRQILSYGVGSHASLIADEYKLDLYVMQNDILKNVIYIFVDGENLGKYSLEECEIRKRFCQAHKHSLLSTSDKKKLKREKKDVQREVEKMTTYYSYLPWWTSFRSMKVHLNKNNKDIYFVNEEDKK